ncbi:unnamed protein product [Oppiella nova]|uniref:Uncharacterized protein n=1 Tax=Oppiella nova TaxID=334625 RepID=A0A7R9LLB5_9ACAR|nr:unnamed protein product [Oppiella nova]CAG2164727.1 unnamed protein product [Oppiella nova]
MDQRNLKNLLDFISNYSDINAICLLLKPNNTRVDVIFKSCLLQLFSHLNKSAADNILFLYTNTHTPGNSATILISELNRVRNDNPDINIKHNKQIIYCINYKPFTYAVAASSPNNIELSTDLKNDQDIKWKRSNVECKRLLDYICGLSTLVVNMAPPIGNERKQDTQRNLGDKQNEITLLMVSESGVEKSTFINAYVNYMTYDTMDEARDGKIKCLLNEKFTLMDQDTYELKTIGL